MSASFLAAANERATKPAADALSDALAEIQLMHAAAAAASIESNGASAASAEPSGTSAAAEESAEYERDVQIAPVDIQTENSSASSQPPLFGIFAFKSIFSPGVRTISCTAGAG